MMSRTSVCSFEKNIRVFLSLKIATTTNQVTAYCILDILARAVVSFMLFR
jgi:hypothetical protein